MTPTSKPATPTPIVLQKTIPFDATDRPLPGIRPLDPDGWLCVDDAFAGQLAYRRHLLATKRDAVLRMDTSARAASEELLDITVALLKRDPQRGYRITGETVSLPDGSTLRLNRADPMGTLCQLVQEDLCILEKHQQEHVLTAASLCFPASWTLSEKFMRPLTAVHTPVASYDDQIARRVQRLFDGVQIGKPLWRHNRHWYADADLHQPRSETLPERSPPPPGGTRYLRVEKQGMVRLPRTRAVVFSIHTYVVAEADA